MRESGASRQLVWLGYRVLTEIVKRAPRCSAPAVWFAAVGMGVAAAGCGSSSSPAGAGTGTGLSPQQVAVAYSQALFAGHLDTARSYVDPPSQPALAVLANSLGSAHVSSRNLAAGSVMMTGDTAVVTLTGTFCNSSSCVTNSSPQSPNPIFRVAETRTAGRWMVTFTAPTSAADAGPAPGPVVAPSTAPARP